MFSDIYFECKGVLLIWNILKEKLLLGEDGLCSSFCLKM